MFELGPGPICWIYMSEVMNEKGVSVGTFLNWFFTMIIGLITAPLINSIGHSATFLIFTATCGSGWLFILFFVKETKGLSECELIELYRPEQFKVQTPIENRSTFLTSNSSSLLTVAKQAESFTSQTQIRDSSFGGGTIQPANIEDTQRMVKS